MDHQYSPFSSASNLHVSSFSDLHMKPYDPTTLSIDLTQQNLVYSVYEDYYLNQFGTFMAPQEHPVLQAQYPGNGLPTPEQQFAVLAQSTGAFTSAPAYQDAAMTPPSEPNTTLNDMQDYCSSTSSESLPPSSPDTRSASPVKNKKNGRRVAQDLPYAPSLINLDLNTTRRRTAKGSKATDVSNSKPAASFLCDYPGCNKAFTRPYNLKSHRRTHTLERPFACEYCPTRFARQHDCNRHEKLHFGIKPYVCEHCHKAFARQDALSRHQKPNTSRAGTGSAVPCASIGPRTRVTKRVKKSTTWSKANKKKNVQSFHFM